MSYIKGSTFLNFKEESVITMHTRGKYHLSAAIRYFWNAVIFFHISVHSKAKYIFYREDESLYKLFEMRNVFTNQYVGYTSCY